MRFLATLALAAALLAAAKSPRKPQRAPAAPAPAEPQAAIVRGADGWRADLALDGPLLGWALPRGADGRRVLYLLAGPKGEAPAKKAEGPCGPAETAAGVARDARLYRWKPGDPERLQSLGSGLPEGSLDAVDLDGDGEDDLILQYDGGIDRITFPPEGTARIGSVVADAEIGKPCCGPRIAWDAAAANDPSLRVPLLGAFRTYGRGAEGGVALVSEIETPVRVRGGPELYRVESPSVRPIGRTRAGRMVFATDPEPLGKRRLRTLLIDPDGPAETRAVESWSLFPEPERVLDSDFAMIQGSPVLIVTTMSADKLSLLGEKALRVYPLGGDRTRAGDNPMFAAVTGINVWQQAHPTVIDLDGDGHEELVLAYWKGLKNSIAALEVYGGAVGGGFGKARSTSFEVDDGKRGFLEFGSDLDGDGRPDLTLIGGSQLLVFPGTPADRSVERPVESRPTRRIALPSDLPSAGNTSMYLGAEGIAVSRSWGGLGTPRLLDLDGDNRPEIVFAGNGGEGAGAGRASIVFVRGSSAVAPASTISR